MNIKAKTLGTCECGGTFIEVAHGVVACDRCAYIRKLRYKKMRGD